MRKNQVIKKPLLTEKGSIAQQENNKYFFKVDTRATKHDIRNAIEELFKVHVSDVRTMNVHGKFKRVGRYLGKTSAWKKAVVSLREGERIESLEGV